ncbi:hypothetical protein QO058_04055 [Bosea vestrisii]|uniref:hypothetical protein n=1 Tax=Bosea vestrisii TaxID=151416 RepID=UPI0024DF3A8A|nr:hypothetical protein [Bosea vestrisii]WID97450.1 hypothetical protein QO058_04055 [Bosea vestrisii]
MIKRLPRYAEIELQRLCAEGGALCHSVDEDESGWDRLIEFPEMNFLGAIDMRPPRSVAYVQVKSARNRKFKCQLKLSNALRAAQSSQPWFILLLTTDSIGKNPKLYALHVWGPLIERILKAARQSEIDKMPLHKSMLTFTFGPNDEKNDTLIEWMHSTIVEVGDSYEIKKINTNKTLGYEGGYGQALMSLEAKSEEEILENFLGLGEGLHISKFVFTPSRFGIPASQPSIEVSSGTVHIQPDSLGEIEIRLRNAGNDQPIILQGKAYPGPPGTKLLRFSASFIDLIWSDGIRSDFRANISVTKKYEIATIETFITLMNWCEKGPVDLQIWFKGKRAVSDELNNLLLTTEWEWKPLASALHLLRTIAGTPNIELSLSDICATPGLKTLAEVLQAPSLRLEFMPQPETPASPLTSIIYWTNMVTGDVSFCALVENLVDEDVILNDGKRQITSRNKIYLESYAIKYVKDENQIIEFDYKHYMESPERIANSIGIGNIHKFLLECQNQSRLD